MSIPLAFRSCFVGNSILFFAVAMYLALKNRSDCLIGMLSLREVSIVGSSRFEQFGAFTYRPKVSRQLSIVLRCLM
ncbi:TPA: hypothetical protein ACGF38_003536, partial [Vibrio cholerae]